MILGNLETELEPTEQDLIKRVEDILGKTEELKKAKKSKKKCKKFKDRLVRETFLKRESQVLQRQRNGLNPPEISDFKIELLKQGQGNITHISESRSSEVGVLDMQETALDAVLEDEQAQKRGRGNKRHRNEENAEVSSRPSNTSSRQLLEQSASRSRR